MIEEIKKGIVRLPLSARARFSLLRKMKSIKGRMNEVLGKGFSGADTHTLIPQNACYGHEFQIKEYCDYDDDVYAVIEHGVFFGDVILGSYPFPQEADIGSFLTFGEYRTSLLQDYYPDKQFLPKHFCMFAPT